LPSCADVVEHLTTHEGLTCEQLSSELVSFVARLIAVLPDCQAAVVPSHRRAATYWSDERSVRKGVSRRRPTGAPGSRIATQLAARGAKLTISGRSADALAALGIDGAHTVSAAPDPRGPLDRRNRGRQFRLLTSSDPYRQIVAATGTLIGSPRSPRG
jgi:hypothetical protein